MCAVTEILNLALRHVAVANMCGWVCPASIHQYARMDRGTFEAFVPYEYEGKVVYSFRCIACDDTHVVRLEGPDAWTYPFELDSHYGTNCPFCKNPCQLPEIIEPAPAEQVCPCLSTVI